MSWRRVRASAAAALILFAFGAAQVWAQQTGRITGRVVDAATNRPLAGAQVFLPPTGIGNITDADGRYLLQNVPPGEHTVTAQLVGYKQASTESTVTVGQTVVVNLSLAESAIQLDEIVVTGAGVATQRKKLGNTIGTIDASKVTTAAVTDVSQLIAGREPGVVVLPSGGYTGEGARIRIRGSSSLSQLNEPIIYVDGIRVDRSSTSVAAQGNPSKLDDIPPESIERIEILKGAAAATLYGTEASNGVIQIFTKKGRSGAPRFTLQVDQTAINMQTDRIAPLADFAETQADIDRISQRWGRNVELYEPFTEDLIPTYFNTGHHQAYALSVMGGGDRITYFVTGRFQDEDGPLAFNKLFPDQGFRATNDANRRAQTAANVVITPIEKVRVTVNTMYSEMDQEVPNNGNNIYGVFPNLTQSFLRLACSEISSTCPKVNLYGTNNFLTANEAVYQILEVESNHFTGSTNVNYAPVQSIRLDGTFGIDFVNESNTFFRPFGWTVDNYATVTPEGTRSIGEIRSRVVTADFKASWEAQLSGAISSTFLAGVQGFLSQRTNREGQGTRFPGPGLEVAGAGADQSVDESWTRNTQVGGYLQEQLGWNDWAFATVGGRWDANSAFGESFNTAFYPKVNVSIVPTEAFGWDHPIFSTIRVRGAIGKSGLQPSSFAKFTTYSPQPSSDGPGIRPSNLGNSDLKPEVSTEMEAGAEIGLFGDRASVNFTLWTTEVDDALVARQFPVSGGFINTQLDNIGTLSKHGLDLIVQGTVLQTENLSLSLFVNGAFLQQEIKDLGGAPALKTGGSYSRYRQYLQEGFAPGSFFGPRLADLAIPLNLDGSCVEPSQADALQYFSEPRNPSSFKPLVHGNSGLGEPNGELASHNCGTGALFTYLGKSTPDWQGTFGGTLSFLGNFDLTTLMEFKAGDYVVHDLSGEFRRSSPTIGRNVPNCAAFEATMRNPASTAQSRLDAAIDWAHDCEGLAPLDGLNSINAADFIRWRELSLTYRVPISFVERFGLASATFSVGARNLGLWVNSAFKGMDPENNINGRCDGGLNCNFLDGTDGWQVPIPRRITFSTRVSF
ncbi:MAG: SusC/RagA family TonB-linked outer membrane protein [Longimicrobiales bacterium]